MFLISLNDLTNIGVIAQGAGALILCIPIFFLVKDRIRKYREQSKKKLQNIQPIRALKAQLDIIKTLENVKNDLKCQNVIIVLAHNNGGIPQPGHSSYMRTAYVTDPVRLTRWGKKERIPDEVATKMIESIQAGSAVITKDDYKLQSYSDFLVANNVSFYYVMPVGILEEPSENNPKETVQNLITVWIEYDTNTDVKDLDAHSRERIVNNVIKIREAYKKWRRKDYLDYSEIIVD